MGREAVEAARSRPRHRRLVSLKLHYGEPLLFHDEPILLDGEVAGRVTSGPYDIASAAPSGWAGSRPQRDGWSTATS